MPRERSTSGASAPASRPPLELQWSAARRNSDDLSFSRRPRRRRRASGDYAGSLSPRLNIGGSEVYRISTDGSPKTIWTSRDDLVYALAFDATGRLIAATGNKGKLYAIGDNDYTDLTKASANQVTALARCAQRRACTRPPATWERCFLSAAVRYAEGTYESDVFDAKIFSKWGRPEVRGQGNYELFARSGNVDNPDRNWSAWKKVDLAKSGAVDAPPARFLQWKVVLHSGTPVAGD